MKHRILAIAFSTLCLVACAQEPSSISIKPVVFPQTNKVYNNTVAELSVNDLRTTAHVVEVLSASQPTELIATADSLKGVLHQEFSNQLAAQGLKLTKKAPVNIKFNVERARTFVNQDVLDYRANTIIKLLVNVETNKQVMSKTFTLRATSRGPLTADLDDLQKNFNRQLAKLITQVVEDEQLQKFIQG
ncbi:YajG family lipoprotein [Thalassotalea ponticola]|uniref:YajG family lipoprotein n=1 Tax=Thalassotalea ponticola TaxID=1523392 RepID=UPI0025B59B3D|nr:YajG family lipoprotein [Thalassotalea ponticola]MDN3652158.1 YajG family lipoprotein [Thalassotalea ponticola]